MTTNVDVLVLGTGSAASTAAYKCAEAGRDVAVVDSRPFGGTCALRGCDPKKVLVGAVEALERARWLDGDGVRADGVSIDWKELMRFKTSFVEDVPDSRERGFEKAGIATVHGRARFATPDSVRVGDEEFQADHVLVATGARPRPLGIPGEEHMTTSTDFLDLEDLPDRIVFVGGGYISFEFAHVVARAGAQATILQRGDRPLAGFDPDLVDLLVRHSRDLGIRVEVGVEVSEIRSDGGGFEVRASRADGRAEPETFDADLVVHGAGRVPEIDDLDLPAADVKTTEQGVKVNEFLQSETNPRVYAAGDAADSGGPPLTPVASMEGHVAASNMLEGNRRTPDHSGVPSVVFTVPPLARVGMGEPEARDSGSSVRVRTKETAHWYSSKRIGEPVSGFKVIQDTETGKILGAHLLGTGAEEAINVYAMAIRFGLTALDLKTMPYSYPTHASDVPHTL